MKKLIVTLAVLTGLIMGFSGATCERGQKTLKLANGHTVPYESIEIKGDRAIITHVKGKIVITIPRSMIAAVRS